MNEGDYESDFENESTPRTSPTKSITLPFSSVHHCFTRTNDFTSYLKTPSSSRSDYPGEKYLRSSFPDLMGNLGLITRSKKTQNAHNLEQSEEESEESNKVKKLSFGEEIRKRNEHQWLRIEDVASNTMRQYDDYCKNLIIKNEIQQKEIQERNRKQKEDLLQLEEKKKEENIKHSSYGKIWNHHAKMRVLAEKLYQEKVERDQKRRERQQTKQQASQRLNMH